MAGGGKAGRREGGAHGGGAALAGAGTGLLALARQHVAVLVVLVAKARVVEIVRDLLGELELLHVPVPVDLFPFVVPPGVRAVLADLFPHVKLEPRAIAPLRRVCARARRSKHAAARAPVAATQASMSKP